MTRSPVAVAFALTLVVGCSETVGFSLEQEHVLSCAGDRCTSTGPLLRLAAYVEAHAEIGDGETERIQSIRARVIAGAAEVNIDGVALSQNPTALSAELVARANTALIFHHEDLDGNLDAVAPEPTRSLTLQIEYQFTVERSTESFVP